MLNITGQMLAKHFTEKTEFGIICFQTGACQSFSRRQSDQEQNNLGEERRTGFPLKSKQRGQQIFTKSKESPRIPFWFFWFFFLAVLLDGL